MSVTSIDFADPRILTSRALKSWAILPGLLGVVLIGYAVTRLVDVERAISKAEVATAAGARAPRQQTIVLPVATEIPAAQVLAANSAIQRMNIPWRDLLDAIEQATPPDIALVELDPNPSQRHLLAEGEAKDLVSMSNYIDRLQKSPLFDGVVLVKHEVSAQNSSHPIRFQFLAQWAKTTGGI